MTGFLGVCLYIFAACAALGLIPASVLAAKARQPGMIAAHLADAVEAAVPPPCDHRDRPSCPKCSARRTFLASARIVRETGGVT